MFSVPTTHIYKTVNGCQIKADVYLPEGNQEARPTVVYIHGGALIYGSRQMFNPTLLQNYLQSGYNVVSIDYRLAPESKLNVIIEDLHDAFKWVYKKGPDLFCADIDKVAVVGHSAGGYLALMAGCCVKPAPKAIVSFYGYGDLIGDWYSKPSFFYCQQPKVLAEEADLNPDGLVISEPYEGRGKDKFYLYCRQNGFWPQAISGWDPHKEQERFTPFCPVQNVNADYPPTLLLHGDQDTDVPYIQSVMMAEELSRCKVEHELITMHEMGHGFDKSKDEPAVIAATAKVRDFLNRHIG